MSEFVVNDDLFGRYCKIETDCNREKHIYKIVGRINSNSFCHLPLTVCSQAEVHTEMLPVLRVIHCGVDETQVMRVAERDCEIIPADVAPVVHGTWELRQEGNFVSVYKCSVCGRQESIGNSILYDSAAMMAEKYPYCHCGSRMDGGVEE